MVGGYQALLMRQAERLSLRRLWRIHLLRQNILEVPIIITIGKEANRNQKQIEKALVAGKIPTVGAF